MTLRKAIVAAGLVGGLAWTAAGNGAGPFANGAGPFPAKAAAAEKGPAPFRLSGARPTTLAEPSAEAASAAQTQGGRGPGPIERAREMLLIAPDPADDISGFVRIPQGPFTMGADRARDPDAFDNERWSPAAGEGLVSLPAFYLARHEVTVAEFTAFARASGWSVDDRALAGPPTHPVTYVSWPDALAYCRWLQMTLQNAPSTPGDLKARLASGWRVTLPSEAEWEKAARGRDGRRYPWGNDPQRTRANYSGKGTMPVGSFPCPECAFGLADMAGNVWEWTSSPYQPYPYDPSDDRANLDADALWVIRGGHFGDDARMVRTTTRGGAEPGARRPFIGFRVAISSSPRDSR